MLISELDLNNKKVLVRVDFNVPMDENQKITDNTRIKYSIKTISYILENGGTCILISHMGRPNGYEKALSLKNIALGIIVSIIIGILAGIIPAFSASRLDPVNAMRK